MLAAWWNFYTSHWTSFLLEIISPPSAQTPTLRLAEFARKHKERVARAYILGMCLLHLSIFGTLGIKCWSSSTSWSSLISLALVLFAPLAMIATFFRRVGHQAVWSFAFCPLCFYLFDEFARVGGTKSSSFLILLVTSHLHNAIFNRFLSYAPASTAREDREGSEFSYFSRSEAIFLVLLPTYGALVYQSKSFYNFGILCLAAFSATYFARTENRITSQFMQDFTVVAVPLKLCLHLLANAGYLVNLPDIYNPYGWLALLIVPWIHNSSLLWKETSLFPAVAALPLLSALLSVM